MHVLCAVDADHVASVATVNHLMSVNMVVWLCHYLVACHAVEYVDVVATYMTHVVVLEPCIVVVGVMIVHAVTHMVGVIVVVAPTIVMTFVVMTLVMAFAMVVYCGCVVTVIVLVILCCIVCIHCHCTENHHHSCDTHYHLLHNLYFF